MIDTFPFFLKASAFHHFHNTNYDADGSADRHCLITDRTSQHRTSMYTFDRKRANPKSSLTMLLILSTALDGNVTILLKLRSSSLISESMPRNPSDSTSSIRLWDKSIASIFCEEMILQKDSDGRGSVLIARYVCVDALRAVHACRCSCVGAYGPRGERQGRRCNG